MFSKFIAAGRLANDPELKQALAEARGFLARKDKTKMQAPTNSKKQVTKILTFTSNSLMTVSFSYHCLFS
jgi:single-stranded DNA-binding protein